MCVGGKSLKQDDSDVFKAPILGSAEGLMHAETKTHLLCALFLMSFKNLTVKTLKNVNIKGMIE